MQAGAKLCQARQGSVEKLKMDLSFIINHTESFIMPWSFDQWGDYINSNNPKINTKHTIQRDIIVPAFIHQHSMMNQNDKKKTYLLLAWLKKIIKKSTKGGGGQQ